MPTGKLQERLKDAETDLAREDLANEMSEHVLAALAQLAQISRNASPALVDASHMVLRRLGATGIAALLRRESLPMLHEVLEAETLVHALQQVDGQLVAAASALLEDQREVPAPESGGLIEEEVLPSRRICDVAYLLLRRLARVDESNDDYLVSSGEYLHRPPTEKDEELLRVAEGIGFSNYLEPEGEEDDDED